MKGLSLLMTRKKSVVTYFKVISQHSPRGTDENHEKLQSVQSISRTISQACEDFAATIIIGEMGYTKCRDSRNVNGFYVSRTDI
jgi:hypothetical protein